MGRTGGEPLMSPYMDKILDAYETFGHAASTGALKVIIEA